jgi:hypothetical protein
MPDRDTLQAQVMEALRAAKPVTQDSALEIALGVLRPADEMSARQFESWFKSNGAAVVEMINRG